MEALRAEVERQKREKTLKREKEEALFKSNDAKNNNFSAYASKKELRRREFEEKEDEVEKEFLETVGINTIIVFILFTYLGWFQWNKDTGLRKIIKAIIQFIFSIIIGLIVLAFS